METGSQFCFTTEELDKSTSSTQTVSWISRGRFKNVFAIGSPFTSFRQASDRYPFMTRPTRENEKDIFKVSSGKLENDDCERIG